MEDINNNQNLTNNELLYSGTVIKKEHLKLIYDKYINGNSLIELSNEFNYNIGTIRNFLKRNQVHIRNVKESVVKFQKQSTINIDEFLEQNLIGWILGDGGLRLFKKSLNPVFNYCDKHLDYVNYVSETLNSYNIKTNISFNKNNLCYQLQSETRPEFHKYYNLFYGYEGLNENNQKRKILPNIKLTPIILKNWYIGDGSSSKYSDCSSHRGSISCKFKNEYILNQLKDICKYGCGCYVNKYNGKISYKYSFGYHSLIEFLNYIGDCPVDSYKYKWTTKE